MVRLVKGIDKAFVRISLNIFSLAKYVFKCRKFRAVSCLKKGFEDHGSGTVTRDGQYKRIFERLADSFNKTKEEQKTIDAAYKVGPMWQSRIDKNSSSLSTALLNRDFSKLKDILENFHREQCSSGTGDGFNEYRAMKEIPFYKYQYIYTWYKYYDIYRRLAGDNSKLTYPQVGNPVGLYFNGRVIPTQAIRHHYYATEILCLLGDVNHPIVCEIGGGLGGLAYSTLSNSKREITYILLDIPEMLVLSSYLLMAAFPEKKSLLFGEGSLNPYELAQYDIILMPNFMLPRLADETVDLFFNSNSFSEMNSETVQEYIRQIERICKKYFMHVNHNARFVWHDDKGRRIVNLPSTDIGLDPARFKKIYQHPRLFASVKDEVFYYNHKAQHFAFLYERIRTESMKRTKETRREYEKIILNETQ
jgi:putative sugar O-methyltransferase